MSYMVSQGETLLQQKINAIQDALQQIELIKKKLHRNANKTTSNIQTAVSRQLETLRNREVWLCEQVQLLQATKQGTLNKQTSELIETLGQLESCLQCVNCLDVNTSHAKHQLANLNKAVENCIARFETLELSAKEDPYISFKGDISALRACIQRFGTIDSKTVCEAVFNKEMHKSACMPSALEEYEDAEHHVLYKPLQSHMPTMVSMRVPKQPSVRPEDWLFLPPDVAAPPEPETPAARPVHVQQWLAQHKLHASPSTHQWLNEIQGQCGTEEDEGYAMVTESATSKSTVSVASDIEVLNHDDFGSQMDDDFEAAMGQEGGEEGQDYGQGVCKYFDQVLQEPSSAWLAASDISTMNCPYMKMKFFSEVSDNLKDWLQKFDEEMKEDEDKDVCCGEGKCATPSSPDRGHVDIENLYELACVQPETSAAKTSSSPRHQRTAATKNQQQQQLAWVLTQGVSDVCKANEPCQTFAECVCPENCCSEKQSSRRGSEDKNRKPIIPTVQQWLRSPADAMATPEAVPDTYQQQLTKNLCVSESEFNGSNGCGSANEWLCDSSQKSSEKESGFSSPGFESPFHRPLSAFSSTSLAKSESDSVITRLAEIANSDTDQWLKKRASSQASFESHPYKRKSDLASWLKAAKHYTEKFNAEKKSEVEDSQWLKTPEKFAKSLGKTKSYSFDAGWLKKGIETSEKSEVVVVDFPKHQDDIAWLLEDKLNIKSEKAPFEICGKVPTSLSFQKSETNNWLKN